MTRVKDKEYKVVKNRSGKSLSVFDSSGRVLGCISVSNIYRMVRGETKGTAVCKYYGKKWHVVGWLNRTMKDGLLKFGDEKGSYIGSVPSVSLFSLIKDGVSFFVTGKRSFKRLGFGGKLKK